MLLYLWPISWAMVIPRSKPVSSAITQLHSLLQAPPSWATPLTCLFPSGNTRSYLWVQVNNTVGFGWACFHGSSHTSSHTKTWLKVRLQISHLVIYRRRSAWRGSESFEGLIFLPHSHTLLRVDVMLLDSWSSGWSYKSSLWKHQAWPKCRSHTHFLDPFICRKPPCEEKGSYIWLWQDDHVDQVHPHVGPQGHVSQQLWGLCAGHHPPFYEYLRELSEQGQYCLYGIYKNQLYKNTMWKRIICKEEKIICLDHKSGYFNTFDISNVLFIDLHY